QIRVLGDSDQFLMLELRRKAVAADQVLAGALDAKATAERMDLWVTPYQQDFLKFPLTLHAKDLPPKIDESRQSLRSFVDNVISHAPSLPSHIEHPQWTYHFKRFNRNRPTPVRIVQKKISSSFRRLSALALGIAKQIAKPILRPLARLLLARVIVPL